MNPPIRCFECGKVLGDKWEMFWELTGMVYDWENQKMTWEEELRKESDDHACDMLGLLRNCCRNMMKSHVEY